MKRIKRLLVLMMVAFMPSMVFAASGSISVSASNTVMLGNTVTVTVKLSSGTAIGSWEMDLNYDKSYLQLTKSSAESGGTRMANSVTSGIKSKSYTFTFKTLKTGTTKISVGSYLAYDFNTMSQISLTSGSKSISIKTKEQIEATYSDNANLSSLSVEGYELTPAFNKDTLEYNLDVENDIEKVTIKASKADGNANVAGDGEVELVEGPNKFEIVVTAQKGNTKKYVLNINRKELDPIKITVGSKEYTVVRKVADLPAVTSYTNSTVTYEDNEVPVLINEVTGYTLIGLKDEDGKVSLYIYKDGNIKDKYIELKNAETVIIPAKLKEASRFKSMEIIDIKDLGVKGYALNKKSKTVIIYAQNVATGKSTYYQYNLKDGSFMVYDDELLEHDTELITNYRYVMGGLIGVIVLLVCLVIFKGKKDKTPKEEIKKVEEVEEDEEESEEDEEESLDITANVELSRAEKKRLLKETKKKAKEERKAEKKMNKDDFDF